MSYQGTFAIITAALISGAIVERMRFSAYMLFIALWAVVVYAPVAHWVWGGGWLATLGALDFAGGTVVHVNAGVAALVAALVLGPRKDFARQAFLPHNVPFTLLGAGLLWFGWFGFNAGSALAASPSAALAFTTTFLAPMGTLVVWTLLDMTRNQKVTAVGGATAIVVGLVAITPAAGFVSPMSAIALGAIAAVPSYYALLWRARTRLDDSLDVVAAHGLGGTVGALLTGVFAEKAWNTTADGLLFGNPAQLGIQAAAVLAAPRLQRRPHVRAAQARRAGRAAPRRGQRGGPRHGREPARRGGLRGWRRRDPGAARSRRAAPVRRSWRRKVDAHEAGGRCRPARSAQRGARGAVPAEVQGLTISRVQGHGGEREHVETYRGTTVKMELSEKVRLEIGVSNHFVEPTVQAIMRGARTGEVGDGKIFVRAGREGVPDPHGRRGPGRGHARHRGARRASRAARGGWGGRRVTGLWRSPRSPHRSCTSTGRGGFVMRPDSSGLSLPWQGLVAGAVGGFRRIVGDGEVPGALEPDHR